MASGTADLQRDLGGAVMQSIFGALLTAGYASAAGPRSPVRQAHLSNVQNELTKSFAGAQTAARYPDGHKITAAAKTAFLHGDQWAYTAGIVAVLLGAVIVFVFFPKRERERELLAAYAAQDAGSPAAEEPPGAPHGAPAA